MTSRQQYLNNEITHDKYFSQFLDDKTESELLSVISLESIQKAKDEHLNDIPLRLWDLISGIVFSGSKMIVKPTIRRELAKRIHEAGEGISSSTLTCIYKQQARKLIN